MQSAITCDYLISKLLGFGGVAIIHLHPQFYVQSDIKFKKCLLKSCYRLCALKWYSKYITVKTILLKNLASLEASYEIDI